MGIQSVLRKFRDLVFTLFLLYGFLFALNIISPDIAGPAWDLLNSFLNRDFLILYAIIFLLASLSKGDE